MLLGWFPDTLPLRAVLFSGLWNFLGGGAITVSTMLWVMVADWAPDEKRYLQVLLIPIVRDSADTHLQNFRVFANPSSFSNFGPFGCFYKRTADRYQSLDTFLDWYGSVLYRIFFNDDSGD